MTGKLLGIATKPASRAPMVLLEAAEITIGKGISGDFRGQMEDRQVTILFPDDWDRVCKISGGKLPWERRRANLLIEGLPNPKCIGGVFTVGQVVLEVTGETKPCNRMNQAFPGLKMLLTPDWRGGVTCRVLKGGEIKTGDHVSYAKDDHK